MSRTDVAYRLLPSYEMSGTETAYLLRALYPMPSSDVAYLLCLRTESLQRYLSNDVC